MEKPSVAILYNPHEQTKEQLIESFVVRCELFQRLFNEIKSSKMEYPEQHYLIEGQRGSGKTTLLLRLSYEIENDNDLNKWLIPIVFKEEAYYGITRLFKLWESIAQMLEDRDPVFSGLFEQMSNVYSEENDYERICFEMLIQVLEKQRKKIILFIDNLGEMFLNFDDMESHRLREILITCPHLRIIGATSIVLEAFFKYEHAFYEFFKKEQLRGLNKEETRKLLLELAKAYQQEEAIKSIIENQPGRVESLRILTGGVIRTIILLFEIFIDHKEGNSISDLEKVLDRVTPLYKHRMDDLTPLQRDVVNTIALNWDAISPKEVAHNTRLKTDEVSTLISELEKVFIIQRAATNTQLHFYHLRERFFNIWYLMRLAPRGGQTKVIWLVRFLESWYTKEELAQRAKKQIQALKKGSYYPKAAYYLTEALARTAKLDMDTEYELISTTREYLSKKDRSLAADLSQSDKELLENSEDCYRNREYHQALKLLLKIKNKEVIYPLFVLLYTVLNEHNKAETYIILILEKANSSAISWLGYLYDKELKDYKKAEKYYLMAVEKGHVRAMNNLGYLYDEVKKDYEKAEKYYLMAVEEGDVDAMNNLGILYKNELKDYKKAEKYYLMAVKKGNSRAMNNLGLLYNEQLKDYEKAVKYYLMAVEKGYDNAMYNLARLYKNELKNYDRAEKFYLMAVEKGYVSAMNSFGNMHYDLKDYKKAEKYYLMAVEKGDAIAMFNLGLLYDEEFKDYKKAEQYYLMAVEKGYDNSMYNLARLYKNELKDYDRAEKFYLMAVEKGHVNAMNSFGNMHYDLKDYKKAEKYYLMAVEQGDASAMFNLGILYDEEFKDYKKAAKYYLMAVEKEHTRAMFNLGLLYDEEFKDYKKAETYYLMAADKGHASAMLNLGLLYDEEFKDYKKAAKYYLMASENDVDEALLHLAAMYIDLKKFKKAENSCYQLENKKIKYYELLIAYFLFHKKDDKNKALKYIIQAQRKYKESLHEFDQDLNLFLSMVYLWNNKIKEAYSINNKMLYDKSFINENGKDISEYVLFLLAKKQYQYVSEYFETPDLNLKERFKPLYYALLYFTGDKNYHKIPPEISEPVQEIIEQIKQMEKDYA